MHLVRNAAIEKRTTVDGKATYHIDHTRDDGFLDRHQDIIACDIDREMIPYRE
jgi:hypothetical protein